MTLIDSVIDFWRAFSLSAISSKFTSLFYIFKNIFLQKQITFYLVDLISLKIEEIAQCLCPRCENSNVSLYTSLYCLSSLTIWHHCGCDSQKSNSKIVFYFSKKRYMDYLILIWGKYDHNYAHSVLIWWRKNFDSMFCEQIFNITRFLMNSSNDLIYLNIRIPQGNNKCCN